MNKMIFAFAMLFIFLGMLFLVSDFFFPAQTVAQLVAIYQFTFQLRIMGLVLVIIGCVVLFIRIVPSGLNIFMDLPNSKIVPLIHSTVRGRDPDAKFMRGKRVDLEIIRAKNKTFKDAGGGFRIMGHSCRRTYETIGFTVPDWLSEYFHKIYNKYLIHNSDEWRQLREDLKGLDPDRTIKDVVEVNGLKQTITRKMTKEEQLQEIKYIEPLLNDPERKQELLAMSWQQLRRIEELIFDGITHNGEEVELFIDSATPNEQDILERQTFVNELERHNRYKDPGEIDFAKYIPWIIMVVLVATVCAILLQGAFGGG